MATFKKGESMKNQRLVVSASYEQKGEGRKGRNVAFSLANDDVKDLSEVKTDPMLVYDTYTDKEGNKKPTYTASYSPTQWEKIEAAANRDGKALVVEGDVFPNKNGKGLVVNTNALKTPEVPFDSDKHKQNTLDARAAKAEARKAQEADKAQETEAEVEVEDELEK